MSREQYERLQAQGLDVETVGHAIDDDWTAEAPPAVPVDPPRLEGQPAFPKPGIYFGMPEDVYHAVPAASTSGLKKLAVSSMDYWANSHLNPDKVETQKDYLDLGKAIHAFVLEGETEYLDRFAVDLDIADFEGQGVLVSTDEIKAAISRFTCVAPVKPSGKGKQDFIDQLAALAAKHHKTVDLEGTVPDLKGRIKEFEEEQNIKPYSRVEDSDDQGQTYTRAAGKDDWINQLLELNPEAKVWDRMNAEHRANHEGKTFVDARTDRRIRIAAKMIMAHEEIGKAFSGGFPEVSVFWHCRKTGAPMKARFDYLKLRALVDLKSFGNNAGMPIDRAIERTIANYRYNLQHVIYVEAAQEAKRMIRESSGDCVNIDGDLDDHGEIETFCEHWSKQIEEPGFIFVFQQTGNAPVTRGKIMPTGTVYSVTQACADDLKRLWVQCAQAYGTDPWLDIQPIEQIDDERIPLHATELGKDD